MKLHFFILATVLFSQTALAQVFTRTGFAQCSSDCEVTALEAKQAAHASANEQCEPELAQLVSEWDVRIRGFGRLSATAAFACAEQLR